jgi:hypothetical protein
MILCFPDGHCLNIVRVTDLSRGLGIVKLEPKTLVMFELNRCAIVQKVVLAADLEAKNAGVSVDTDLKPDDIEFNDVSA